MNASRKHEARPVPKPNRPPWKLIASMLGGGCALVGAGAALDSVVLMMVGGLLFVPLPLLLLLPALRISAARTRSTMYRDADFVGGGMHVAGFTTEEIRGATEAARGKVPPPEGR